MTPTLLESSRPYEPALKYPSICCRCATNGDDVIWPLKLSKKVGVWHFSREITAKLKVPLCRACESDMERIRRNRRKITSISVFAFALLIMLLGPHESVLLSLLPSITFGLLLGFWASVFLVPLYEERAGGVLAYIGDDRSLTLTFENREFDEAVRSLNPRALALDPVPEEI